MTLEIIGIITDVDKPEQIITKNGIALELNKEDTELIKEHKGCNAVVYNVRYTEPE